jgi:hypothetical protein
MKVVIAQYAGNNITACRDAVLPSRSTVICHSHFLFVLEDLVSLILGALSVENLLYQISA